VRRNDADSGPHHVRVRARLGQTRWRHSASVHVVSSLVGAVFCLGGGVIWLYSASGSAATKWNGAGTLAEGRRRIGERNLTGLREVTSPALRERTPCPRPTGSGGSLPGKSCETDSMSASQQLAALPGFTSYSKGEGSSIGCSGVGPSISTPARSRERTTISTLRYGGKTTSASRHFCSPRAGGTRRSQAKTGTRDTK
jgi:hypothetical protein